MQQNAKTSKRTSLYIVNKNTNKSLLHSRYHCNSFKNRERRNATEFSKQLWKAKDSNISPTMKWSIEHLLTNPVPKLQLLLI